MWKTLSILLISGSVVLKQGFLIMYIEIVVEDYMNAS